MPYTGLPIKAIPKSNSAIPKCLRYFDLTYNLQVIYYQENCNLEPANSHRKVPNQFGASFREKVFGILVHFHNKPSSKFQLSISVRIDSLGNLISLALSRRCNYLYISWTFINGNQELQFSISYKILRI